MSSGRKRVHLCEYVFWNCLSLLPFVHKVPDNAPSHRDQWLQGVTRPATARLKESFISRLTQGRRNGLKYSRFILKNSHRRRMAKYLPLVHNDQIALNLQQDSSLTQFRVMIRLLIVMWKGRWSAAPVDVDRFGMQAEDEGQKEFYLSLSWKPNTQFPFFFRKPQKRSKRCMISLFPSTIASHLRISVLYLTHDHMVLRNDVLLVWWKIICNLSFEGGEYSEMPDRKPEIFFPCYEKHPGTRCRNMMPGRGEWERERERQDRRCCRSYITAPYLCC